MRHSYFTRVGSSELTIWVHLVVDIAYTRYKNCHTDYQRKYGKPIYKGRKVLGQ